MLMGQLSISGPGQEGLEGWGIRVNGNQWRGCQLAPTVQCSISALLLVVRLGAILRADEVAPSVHLLVVHVQQTLAVDHHWGQGWGLILARMCSAGSLLTLWLTPHASHEQEEEDEERHPHGQPESAARHSRKVPAFDSNIIVFYLFGETIP